MLENFEKDFKERQKEFDKFKKDNQSNMSSQKKEFNDSRIRVRTRKSEIESRFKRVAHHRSK